MHVSQSGPEYPWAQEEPPSFVKFNPPVNVKKISFKIREFRRLSYLQNFHEKYRLVCSSISLLINKFTYQ